MHLSLLPHLLLVQELLLLLAKEKLLVLLQAPLMLLLVVETLHLLHVHKLLNRAGSSLGHCRRSAASQEPHGHVRWKQVGHGEADRLGGDPELLWARLPRVERQVCQLAGRSPGASKTAIRRGHGLRSRSRPCGRTRGVERAATKRRCRQRRGCARGLPIERHDRALVVVVRLSLERTFPPSAASAREVGGLALGRRRQRKSMRQPGSLREGLPGAAHLQARHAPGSRMAEDHRAGELTRRQPRAQIRQGLVLGGAQGCHGKRVRSPSRRRGRAGALR
mmetsp:Transcript_9691/g.37709  ORF Transcript_9691/g.37709 Transcript_9691/m.37709 type:complete len:278 (-) Transcript_9691:683-1516(-)